MDKIIEDTISDLAIDFLFYDRANDDGLPLGVIEQQIEEGKLTLDEIGEVFKSKLHEKSM